ncbi:PhoPQ-activated protein PqaA family protein [Providencia rettgeri]
MIFLLSIKDYIRIMLINNTLPFIIILFCLFFLNESNANIRNSFLKENNRIHLPKKYKLLGEENVMGVRLLKYQLSLKPSNSNLSSKGLQYFLNIYIPNSHLDNKKAIIILNNQSDKNPTIINFDKNEIFQLALAAKIVVITITTINSAEKFNQVYHYFFKNKKIMYSWVYYIDNIHIYQYVPYCIMPVISQAVQIIQYELMYR